MEEIETDTQVDEILLAASNHDVSRLRNLLRNSSANVQDPETGFTPLHSAIAACEEDTSEGPKLQTNGNTNGETAEPTGREKELEAAAKTVKYLFLNGAIWNDLDFNNETPGCIALRLGLNELYELVMDAGVRAEMLLSRLDEYQILGDNDDEEDDDEGFEIIEDPTTEGATAAPTTEAPSDAQAATPAPPAQESTDPSTTQPVYLAGELDIAPDTILDSSANAVMMSWETPIMKRSAELLLPTPGLRVLNIGHGLGIIDDMFQESSPKSHHIIEAHPDVLAQMKQKGWMEKKGVVVHEGRWQDVLPKLVGARDEDGEEILFDAIYFDTFAEEYSALRDFFTEWVIQVLDPAGGKDGDGGSFGFFNGMGADRQVCYDVYQKVVEMDLFEAGFDIEWEDIEIADLQSTGEWTGVKRPYWSLKTYRLPTCKFIG
ncbi:arginine N-methyltransferas-like protein [Aulographum hederae CBS 113979]|uniref:Arginine N-methyltransferase 2 n=1 Tax=Aulographum hederae CBS 113979 TaxID=1176131 RepID=A0A6G1GTV6_9PEZI|nr:arginine N-methyltransferas-like protein [Aulographum hederae CBS 113979]